MANALVAARPIVEEKSVIDKSGLIRVEWQNFTGLYITDIIHFVSDQWPSLLLLSFKLDIISVPALIS